MVISVAMESLGNETARGPIEKSKSTYVSLIDRNHLVADLYNMDNVPQAVWIDEAGTIVRPTEVAGLRIGQIIGYGLVVETIFGWPGLGQVLVNAVLRRDYPVAQFFSLVLITIVVLSNWLADVGYTLVNPRLRKA